MLDASAVVGMGIFRGNFNFLGNYDQCLAIRGQTTIEPQQLVKYHGQYCTLRITSDFENHESVLVNQKNFN